MAEAAQPFSQDLRQNAETSTEVMLRNIADSFISWITFLGAVAMVGLLVMLTAVLAYGAWPAIQTFGFQFIVSRIWNPVVLKFGAFPFIMGTMVSSLLALLIAAPLSILSAVCIIRLLPGWIKGPISFLIELLAAIPSIAYGLWGIAVLIPLLQRYIEPFLHRTLGWIPGLGALFSGPAYGFSMLAGALVISIMVIPIITAITRDVLNTVPAEVEEGAYALGATWWQAMKVVLHHGRLGIMAAVILGFARAIGETMAVTMVIGNTNSFNLSLFAPGQTMASVLANQFLEADKPLYLQALIYIGFLLLVITLLLNLIGQAIVIRFVMGRPSTTAAATDAPPQGSAAPAESGDHKEGEKIAKTPRQKFFDYTPPAYVRIQNVLMAAVCVLATAIVLFLLFAIFGNIIYKGAFSLNLDFFTKLPGPPGQRTGMRNQIIGTLILIGLASIAGVPLGMLCGIYLATEKYKNRFGVLVRLVVDVLAGTPSIIVGVLAYELVVVPMGHFSGWAGGLALGFMMCPIVARTTEQMMRLVPDSYREAALSLGASRFMTLVGVELPAAAPGIITGIMLAVARVAGETAPLLFTVLGSDDNAFDPNNPFPSLTLKIFYYATSAEPQWISQAWAGMVVLIAVVTIISAIVKIVTNLHMAKFKNAASSAA